MQFEGNCSARKVFTRRNVEARILREENHIGQGLRPLRLTRSLYDPATGERLALQAVTALGVFDLNPGFVFEELDNSGIVLVPQTFRFRRGEQTTDDGQRR